MFLKMIGEKYDKVTLRIFTGGYHYNPVHSSIYGTNRARSQDPIHHINLEWQKVP